MAVTGHRVNLPRQSAGRVEGKGRNPWEGDSLLIANNPINMTPTSYHKVKAVLWSILALVCIVGFFVVSHWDYEYQLMIYGS